MTRNHHEHNNDQTLAGEYVLGTLSLAERQEVEARLTHDVALQKAVAAWEERFLPYTALTQPVAPSDYLWPRIKRSLNSSPAHLSAPFHTPQRHIENASYPRRSVINSLPVWRSAAGLGLAAALVMGVLLATDTPVPTTPEYMVVLMAPQNQSAGWVVQASTQQSIQLIPLGTFEVPEGKALEFWTKADDWQAPVSLGLVTPGEPINVNLNELPPLQDNQLFELTLEEETGSATGLPTGPIEFIGRAVEI